MINIRKFAAIIFFVLSSIGIFAQTTPINPGQLGGKEFDLKKWPNPVETAVPFLTIAPDSRAGGMGDVGAATTPDINSMHWNPAKYAFIENDGGVSISYSPWLRHLVGDIDLAYLSFYKRLDRQQVIAASLLYFSLGEIDFTNDQGQLIKPGKPNEFALDVAYSRLFGEHFSGGIAFRYIRSDLSTGLTVNDVATKAGQSVAADVSAYYNTKLTLSDKNAKLAFGANISNIGMKITYTSDQDKDFIPTNLRLGGSFLVDLDDYNSVSLAADVNKLLVPTRPVYWTDINGSDSTDADGNKIVRYGKDPDVSVVQGIFQSFYDSPGGFEEELREITYSVGLEYWYRKQFALRAGYFHENEYKGNRKFFTMGVGLKLNVLGIDFSYLIPSYANHPLANTLRFSILFDFDAFRKLKN
ncbi:MAG TPA: type IX secretion system outer membrane channel protein PorV [Bacteroidales bacterium]|nr:type IX secretion system outer membrane channel protein PorV [Bacteroidales bacterium]